MMFETPENYALKIMFIMVGILLCAGLAVPRISDSSSEVKHSPKLGQTNKVEGLSVQEWAIAACTNKERAKVGLAPVRLSLALTVVARNHSQNMCSAKVLKHETDVFPKGWEKFEQRLKRAGVSSGGENLAYHTKMANTEQWAALIVQGWMKSPEHKRNIINPDYRFIGVGIAQCEQNIDFVTQLFSPDQGKLIPEKR